MIVKTYQAVPGSHLSDKDASRIGSFLDRKFGDDPRTAADVVRAARPVRSPIHGDFEWDDSVAADEYRLAQARKVMRSIQVVLVNGDAAAPTRAFHRVVIASGQTLRPAYVPSQVVWANPDLADQVITEAKRKLESWERQYAEYEALAPAAAKVREIVEGLAA